MRKYLLILLLLCVSQPVFGTAKTLPKGLWSFALYQEDSSVGTIGVNPSNDERTWHKKHLEDATLGDLPSFQQVNAGLKMALESEDDILDLTTPIAEWWNVNKLHFDLAYGITSKLTAFANFSYDSSRIRFTDGFIEQMGIANTYLPSLVPSSPRYMKAHHLNDTFVGLKYGMTDDFSLTARSTFGPFKTGRDDHASREIDGVKEIPTGTVYDQYELYANYDVKISNITVRLLAGGIFKSQGYQNFFDNQDITMQLGPTYLLGIGFDHEHSPKWTSRTDITVLHSGKDKVKEAGSWRTLPVSDSNMILAKFGVTYSPVIFFQVFADAMVPLHNDLRGKLYDVPGRLETDWNIQYGVRLFYM